MVRFKEYMTKNHLQGKARQNTKSFCDQIRLFCADMCRHPVSEGSRRPSDVVATATATESIGEVHLDRFHIQIPIDFNFLQSLIFICIQNILFSFNNVLQFVTSKQPSPPGSAAFTGISDTYRHRTG